MDKKLERAKAISAELMPIAGIKVDGDQPWDIQIHNDEIYTRVLRDASLGLGESYMDGWWDCERLDIFIEKLSRARLYDQIKQNKKLLFDIIIQYLLNFQTKDKSITSVESHYDIGNDLYELMLDASMAYTCGYWKTATSLEQSQHDKMDLICRKLQLQPGMRVLDAGCGFGCMARFAAKNYGVEVVAVNISKEQIAFAKTNCKGLPVTIRFQDYRDVNEKFDRIIALGIMEHVGHKNYAGFMKTMHGCLKDGGMLLVHTVGSHFPAVGGDPWVHKYIFPNAMLPSIKQLAGASEKFFVIEDWHNFGADYDKTLMEWHANLKKNWHLLKDRYDERFYRMWEYYLLSFAGSFRARDLQLWQIVLSKGGVQGGYIAPR